ncbi:hypothetical protein C4J81_07680 [Deltaproteobacteria bacterium Smac51]|nr:hypothetical protein C4J81_07680 [Deltaproteobacteria bacterium Smac51]
MFLPGFIPEVLVTNPGKNISPGGCLVSFLNGFDSGQFQVRSAAYNGSRAMDGETERQRLVLTRKQLAAKQKPRFLRSYEP